MIGSPNAELHVGISVDSAQHFAVLEHLHTPSATGQNSHSVFYSQAAEEECSQTSRPKSQPTHHSIWQLWGAFFSPEILNFVASLDNIYHLARIHTPCMGDNFGKIKDPRSIRIVMALPGAPAHLQQS